MTEEQQNTSPAEPVEENLAEPANSQEGGVEDAASDPPEAAEFGNVTKAVADQPEKPVEDNPVPLDERNNEN